MKTVRVGVIGTGWIAENAHVPAYVDSPKARLVALRDNESSRMNKLAQRYGISECFTDYHQLFESGLVDAVSICTPTETHSMISIEAVRGGIHVLCEKPLVSNLDDAELIRREVEREKVRFMVGFNYRFLPNHVMARRFAHDGRIGRPIFIRGQSVTAGAYRADIPPSHYAQESKKRIGALFDMESHLADLFIWQAG